VECLLGKLAWQSTCLVAFGVKPCWVAEFCGEKRILPVSANNFLPTANCKLQQEP
jgi:hypothetical protein